MLLLLWLAVYGTAMKSAKATSFIEMEMSNITNRVALWQSNGKSSPFEYQLVRASRVNGGTE